MKKTPRFTFRFVLALLVAVSPLGLAMPRAAYSQDHNEKGKIAIPDTVPAIWTEINKHEGELTATTASDFFWPLDLSMEHIMATCLVKPA